MVYKKEDGITTPRYICDHCAGVIYQFKELSSDDTIPRTATFHSMPLSSDPDNDGDCSCCHDDEDFEDDEE